MLKPAVKAIADFQKLIGQDQKVKLADLDKDVGECASQRLSWASITMSKIDLEILELYYQTKDTRLLRAHLILSEAAELFDGLSQYNELEVLDGLADLLVVTLGTGLAFKLPLSEAFNEVHKSNMTKTADVPFDRGRFKGKDFKPPNLERLLT